MWTINTKDMNDLLLSFFSFTTIIYSKIASKPDLDKLEKLPFELHLSLTPGKIVVGKSRAFIGTQDEPKEMLIGDRPVKYLTSAEYEALSEDEKMKDIAYMTPD